jgi:hypothetical protein
MKKWICLKDKFPEDGKYYLFIEIEGFPFIGIWKDGEGSLVDGKIYKSTHWMSLPEPPK